MRTFVRHSIERRLTSMPFFKIRATGRVTWQAPAMRYEMLRPHARALLVAPHAGGSATRPWWPWIWCSVPEWLAKTPQIRPVQAAGRQSALRREALRSLHELVDHSRAPCRVRGDDEYFLGLLEGLGGWRNKSACARLRGVRVDFGVCGWARARTD